VGGKAIEISLDIALLNCHWKVLFVTTAQLCRHCVPAVLQYESAAAEFKDFVDFCAVSIFEQFDVVQWFTVSFFFVGGLDRLID
jgi:hypothetical protein